MAITRTQIARQLYRIGGVGGRAKEGSVERTGGSSNRERGITRQFKGPSGTTGRIDTRDADPRRPDRRAVSQFSQFGRNVMAQNLKPKRFQGLRSLASKFNPLSFILGLINPALGIASRFVTSAPDTFQTFKDSPTLADFLENMKTKKISDISVDSGRGSGLRPTIDMKKPVGPFNLNDFEGLTNLDFINRISESDMSLTPEQKEVIKETSQEQADDEFLKGAIADLNPLGLTQMRNLEKKKGMEQFGGPTFTDEDAEMLKELQRRMDDKTKTYGPVLAADGGMIGGGIMDAAGRQQYFLGKLVKKAKRAVKKIVKSPVGKLGLGALVLGAAGGFKPSGFLRKTALPFLMENKELAGAAGLIAAPFLFGNQEDDTQQLASMGSVGGQIDPRAYTDPYSVLFGAFKAEGGSMKDEPVAKRTMPLLDMGGQEMDLRAEGGFVPIGRMEKADDVPARLSKNEFVFTADAVRNAGDGDVDKGAEVMYNMMKNLEAGGNVSEESQGLEGARNMFQTSKRLEEVI